MKTVLLNGRTTTCLGFGGSLLGSTTPSDSKRLLCGAFDAGIRHFDVAPMYGFGKAEHLLGKALGSRMQDITVTSKYGLSPPFNSSWIGPIHRFARAILKPFPAVKRRLQATTGALTAQAKPPLTSTGAKRSIEATLRELGTSSIDLLLLHEANPERLPDNRLLDFLEDLKRSGQIRDFGIGSRSEYVSACLVERPSYCNLVQYEWSVFSPSNPLLESVPRITHGSLAGRRLPFIAWLSADSTRCGRWSGETGADLNNEAMVNRLLLKASLMQNAGHITLFSSKSITRIQANVETAEDRTIEEAARVFHRLVRQEFLSRGEQPSACSQ